MSIQTNASPDELDSPYFRANEKLCNDWNDYILEKGGKVQGVFNAWSFSVQGIVFTNREWLVDVKKATYSNGSIFLSLNKNLFESLTFKTIIRNSDCPNFTIRKSGRSWYSGEHLLFTSILHILKDGFRDKSVYRVTFKNGELTITFHHKNDWFEMADRILFHEF